MTHKPAHASLFSGIGGFDLAAERVGWENVFQVEIDKFCLSKLAKNFPNATRYEDIKNFSGWDYAGKIDVLSGGFPCQPFSVAGERKGKDDDRFLWYEMLRVIKEIRPKYVVCENVPGIITLALDEVLTSLENQGYTTETFILPAAGLNAPHRRDRVWIIAYSENIRWNGRRNFSSDLSGTSKYRIATSSERSDKEFANIATNGNAMRKLQQKGIKQEEWQRTCNSSKDVTDTLCERFKRNELRGSFQEWEKEPYKSAPELHRNREWDKNWVEVASELCRVDDGLPNRVARLKALGNAIVPQIAVEIFSMINQREEMRI